MARYSNKRIGIVDVAEYAGVSIATVSKILNGKDEHISTETRERVLEAVKALNYVPNDMARRLKERSSKTIGLVLPDVNNAFPEMAQGAEAEARKRDYNLFFCTTDGNPIQEARCLRTLVSKMVDGIIYVSSDLETSETLLSELTIPCVAVDRFVNKRDNIGIVQVDNHRAMRDVARFIKERGAKKICYITADVTQSPARERLEGLLSGLKEIGLELPAQLLYTGSFDVETGYIGAMNLLSRDPEIDCIVCGNDMIAIGVINVCHKMGKAIPSDVKVIGFDDIYLAKYLNPELTTVRQDAYGMGKCAAKMLIDYVESDIPLSTVVLSHEIIQRGTV